MTRIMTWREIEKALPSIDLIKAMEEAFVAYSAGRAVVPPVGELIFDHPPGDTHIKYGYLAGDEIFVIKVASGFYDNPKKGLPATSGLVLVLSQQTGLPLCVLLDEGHLTNLRTAAAGAVAAKHLARKGSERIAVLGAGVQGRLQVELLAGVVETRSVAVWARRRDAAAMLAADLAGSGWQPAICSTAAEAVANADIIVTATAAAEPLLRPGDLKRGAHVTAMGSDTPHKQELDADLVAAADVLVADSRSQCIERGEIHHAVELGLIAPGAIVELGEVIAGTRPGRTSDDQLTIADLTGVAVQDIAIAKAVLLNSGGTDGI